MRPMAGGWLKRSKRSPSPGSSDRTRAGSCSNGLSVRIAQRQAAVLMTTVVGVSAYLAPAALVIYWITGNLIAIVQQLLLAPRILH